MLMYITCRIRPDTLLADVGCCNASGRVFFRMVTFLCVKGMHFALLPIVGGRSIIIVYRFAVDDRICLGRAV